MSDDTPYSNRELKAVFKRFDGNITLLYEKILEHRVESKEENENILEQTTNTNGRVTVLETDKIKADQTIMILKWVSMTIIFPVLYLILDKFI